MNTFDVMHSGFKSVDSTGSSGPVCSQKAQKLIDDYMSAVRRVAHPDEVDGEHGHMEGEGDVEEESQQVHEQELNGKVLYDLSGGTPHGRFAIANGAVRTADIRSATKENNIRPSNSVSRQSMEREVAHLRRENTRLQQEKDNLGKVAIGMMVHLYRRVGEEVPEEALSILSATQPTHGSTSAPVRKWPHVDSFVAMDFSCTESHNHVTLRFQCHLVLVTGSSHVGSESTNDDVRANEGIHSGSRVALETMNYHNEDTGVGAGAGAGAGPIED